MNKETKIIVKRTKSSNTDFVKLITFLDNDLSNRYLVEQAKYDEYNEIELIDTVVVIYDNQKPIGCGCFKSIDSETAEIKRMFVNIGYRGKGFSRIILTEIEKWAVELGYSKLILETGKKQPEAIRLYETSGFRIMPNYGQYVNMPNSVCFEKKLEIE